MRNLKFNNALIVALACTSQAANSASLAISNEIMVAANGDVLPFGDNTSNTGGPQIPNGSGGFDPSGANFRYAVRERENAGQTNRKIATFIQFDLSSLSAADVNDPGFSAAFTITHVGHLNNLNTGMALMFGRVTGGIWDDGGAANPNYLWAGSSADQVAIASGVDVASAAWMGTQPISVDTTAIVKDWVLGNTSNQGLVLFGLDDGGIASQASYLENAQLTTATIPEPSSLALSGLGILGLIARRRRLS